jgi:hypothetical protein
MSFSIRRLTTGFTVAIGTAAIIAPGAGASVSYVSADAGASAVTPSSVDLRSPDARDTSPVVTTVRGSDVVRSPDARDGAPGTTGQPVVIRVVHHGGFDWGDAGIGAGGALVLLSLGFAGTTLSSRRRHRPAATSLPAVRA